MKPIETEKIALLDSMIEESRKVVLTAHMGPDGDAVGSTTALAAYLEEVRGKEVKIVLPDPVPESISFITEGYEDRFIFGKTDLEACREAIGNCDLQVTLDYNDFKRTGILEEMLSESKARKLMIDHHLNPSTEAFDIVFSETQVSSACELLFHILMKLPDIGSDASKLPKRSADALMAGMTTDTNNFANSVFPETLQMASALLAAGVDRAEILSNIYNKYRENRLRLMGLALKDLMKITDKGVAYIVMRKDVLDAYDVREGETEGFVNLPLALDKVRMSILLKQEDDHFRVSIRSKKGVSANKCSGLYFNGGGHEMAAGGRLYVPKDISDYGEAEKYIEKVTDEFFS
ncbi:MAG: DHH family phosphoesterase [Bacteroidales bacterium]|nr:DHH family phosphoesterase [Bacteroidales bacterium]